MPCNLCELSATAMNTLVPARGKMIKPKILFVGIAPGPDEDASNRCFSGRSGRLLDDIIRELGIPADEVAYDNIVHCIPWMGNLQGTTPRDPTDEDIVNCAPYLYRLIQMSDPEVIVPLGTLPFRVLTGDKFAFITDRHGVKEEVELCGKTRKIIGTFHPAAALRQKGSSQYRDAIKEDIAYAWEYAIGKYFLPKWRVINDTDEAVDYIKDMVQRYKSGDIAFVAYDTETPQLITSDLNSSEKRNYGLEFVNQDLWRDEKRVVGFSLSYIPKSCQSFRDVEGVWIVMDHAETKTDYFAISETLRWALDKLGPNAVPVACHNAKYDKSWTFEKFKFRMINFHDTMMGSYAYYGNSRRHGLGMLTHRLLKYDLFKDDTEERLAAMPVNERSFRNLPLESIGRRGAIDAAGTASLAVFENMMLQESGQDKVLMPLLNTAVETFTDMELRGCAIDYDFWKHLTEKYPRMMEDEYQRLVNLPMVKAYCEDRRTRWTRTRPAKNKPKFRKPDPKFVFNPSSPDHRYELLYYYYNLPVEDAIETAASTEDNKVYSTNEGSRHQQTAHCREDDNQRVAPGPMRRDKNGNWCSCRCYVDGWDTFETLPEGGEIRTFVYHTGDNYQKYGINPHIECLQFLITLRFWGKLAKLHRSYVTKIQDYFRPDEWHQRNQIAPDVRIISFNYLMHWTKTGRMSTRDWSVHTAPWHCLHGGTKIPLLDGRTLTIKEIVDEFAKNPFAEMWTYSLDDKDKVVPGRILGGTQTYDRAPIVRVTLDNDKSILCTGSHLFRTRNRGYVRAEDLTPDDSISPLYRKDDGYGYEMTYDLSRDQWDWTHKLTCPDTCPSGSVRHHKDFNRLNNSPSNLHVMTWEEHVKLHRDNWSVTLFSPFARARHRQAMNRSEVKDRVIKPLLDYANSDENRERLAKYNDENRAQVSFLNSEGLVGVARIKRDPEMFARFKRSASETMTAYNKSPEKWRKRARKILDQVHLRGLHVSKETYESVRLSIDKKAPTWDTARSLLSLNHRIVKIEHVDGLYPVYDIMVDKYSNFALDAGVFVHNSDIRRMHCSRWKSKGGILISADYSQLELRIAAAIAQDAKLIQAYREGKDVHRVTAAAVWRVAESEVTKDMRRYSKTISFRLIYGGGAHAISTETHLPIELAQKLVTDFLKHYDGLDRLIKRMHSHVKKLGWVPTPIGRKFYMPDVFSDEREKVAGALRDSQNWPIQSTASDVTMTAINEVSRFTHEMDLMSHVWAMIHDAIESDVYPGELFAYYQIMKFCMERRVGQIYDWLTVPMVADFEIGVRWDGSMNIGFGDFKDPKTLVKRFKDIGETREIPDWYENMLNVIKSRDPEGMFTPRRLVLHGRKQFFDELVTVMGRGYDIGSKIHYEMPIEIGEELVLRKSYEGESGGDTDVLGEIFFKKPLKTVELV